MIAAIGQNNEMGRDGDLMWSLPHDMKRFQKITSGHPMIMGRKTFESFPGGMLPRRKHIILTRNKNYKAEGAVVVQTVDEALKECDLYTENFVIGGAAIYETFLPLVNRMYLTHIHATFEGADTYFPSVEYSLWDEIERIEMSKDEKHKYPFTYVNYLRK
ncbi:MAG: dihydrofolate reductase [Bacteroidetes bacterium]|nr:dihydrofolate reductase [Bacteroidota bacterium]